MKATRYKTVKVWATALLVLMVVLYAVARSFEQAHPAWHWVRAFAEAGMIGALADWFAVVALFRHPLGLPIPHTAIIKKQKNNIGVSLGRFVRNNFLTAEIIGGQIRKNEIVLKALEWVSEEENTLRITEAVEREMPSFIEQEGYRSTCKKLSTLVCERISEMPIEKGAGSWMVQSMHGEEFRGVVAPLFGKLAEGITENKQWVEKEAGERAPISKSRIISKLTRGVTKAVSGHMVGQFSHTLSEASKDLNHSFYDKLEDSIKELGAELQSEEENNEWSRWRTRILESKGTHDTMEEFLYRAGELAVLEKTAIKEGVSQTLSKLAESVKNNPEERARWEDELVAFITKLSDHYGDAFEELVNTRVHAWDADALSNKIEQSVGADLQFIRINGSVIGGLIGVTLYGVGLLIWG